MRNQTNKTLLTHWQDERGDHSPRVADEARRRLVEKYQYLVYSPNRDYMQAANEALPRCIDACEPTKLFSAFANPAIYRAIRDYKQSRESGETGAVYRPEDSDDSFKYRWTRTGQKEMLLTSEVTDGRRGSDLSFDYRYDGCDCHERDFRECTSTLIPLVQQPNSYRLTKSTSRGRGNRSRKANTV